MVKVNREFILKSFLDKVKEAKRLGMKEVKIPIRELDDLAYVIYQLMAEEISKSLDKLQVKPEEPKVNKPINRRVLEEIKIVKKHEEEQPKEQKVEEIKEEPKVEEELKVIEEPIQEEVEEDEETEVNGNSLYGGTW